MIFIFFCNTLKNQFLCRKNPEKKRYFQVVQCIFHLNGKKNKKKIGKHNLKAWLSGVEIALKKIDEKLRPPAQVK